ncbi:hypothetical protein ACG83_39930 [Frankia sp. R43]|uniref:hypothetical protein n=1 Tax=Frankia sp. R43 TaxID=269536 RepID=UPI0006CA5A33|nr:hypothetical protein [Frankia sp. R43]KPM50482.1 hypothetical protein ACG83_39930 [Frankia sp. R43]
MVRSLARHAPGASGPRPARDLRVRAGSTLTGDGEGAGNGEGRSAGVGVPHWVGDVRPPNDVLGLSRIVIE